MTIPNPRETIVLAVFFLLGNLGGCVYLAAGRAPSSRFILIYTIGVFWAIAAWIIADARRLGVALPFAIGWFAFSSSQSMFIDLVTNHQDRPGRQFILPVAGRSRRSLSPSADC